MSWTQSEVPYPLSVLSEVMVKAEAAKAELTAKVAAAKAFALSKAEKVDLTSAKKALAPVMVKAEAAKAELTAKVTLTRGEWCLCGPQKRWASQVQHIMGRTKWI